MAAMHLSGVVAGNRVEQITRVQGMVSAHGSIVDFRFFSDLSVLFEIELDGKTVYPLLSNLKTIIRIDEPPVDEFKEGAQVHIYLHLYFVEGKGNLKVDTPAVPG